MAITPHLGLTLVEQAQAQKEVTVNMALMRIDALLNSSAADKDLAAPPPGPAEGDVYIVGASATGEWEGRENAIAYFEQVWRFITPNEGVMLWVRDEDAFYVFDGGNWVLGGAGTGSGEGATALAGLSDVGLSAVGEGEVLAYDATAGEWVNHTLAGAGIAAASHGHMLADISDAGALAGKSGVDNSDWSGAALTVGNGGTGLASVTADCLLRGNGSGALQESGVRIDADDCLFGFRTAVKGESGGSYSLQAADGGKVVETADANAVTLTLPANLPKGFTVTVVQMGAGQVTFAPAAGAVLHSRGGHDRTAGQYAMCTLYVSDNGSGESAVYILAGDSV